MKLSYNQFLWYSNFDKYVDLVSLTYIYPSDSPNSKHSRNKVYQLVREMAKEASSVIMEISDEEGEQIDGGKRNYDHGDAARSSKQLSQKKYSKKRKFHGNQFTIS